MADCSKHFNCVTPANFAPLNWAMPAAIGAILGLLALITSNPVLAVGMAASMTILIFEVCGFLEGGKGICLEKDVCVIGRVLSVVPVGADKDFLEKIDDDLTFNIMVGPHQSDITREAIALVDQRQGRLINADAEIDGLGLGYVWSEDVTFERTDGTKFEAPALHCEIKGCRTHNMCIVLKTFGVAMTIASAICTIPGIGWVVCAIALLVITALAAIVGGIVWAASHGGSLADVMDPDSATLESADENGFGGDFVIVTGDWIYDAGHKGWHEVHPVRSIQKITVPDEFNGDTPADAAKVKRFEALVLDPHCARVSEATEPLVVDAQGRPENQWRIHPSVDGCREDPVIR